MLKKEIKLKGVLVVLDGLGDLPTKQLGGKTPLEFAKTPSLDSMASRGELGLMHTVAPGYSPGSDEAIVSMFANDVKESKRGWIECVGAGLNPKKGDITLRVNFGTIDSLDKGNVVDRRAGRTLTNKEARALADEINRLKFPYKFEFVSTVQHRASLVIHGDFSDKIYGNDMTYQKGRSDEINKITDCLPVDKTEKSKHTCEVLNEFLVLTHEILKNHPVNLERKKKGLMPANYLFFRGPGVEAPQLKQYSNWISTHSMPLEIGFSKLSGIKNFGFLYPELKGLDVYKNLWDGMKKSVKNSIKVLKKNYDKAEYCYIHIKETDLPGHDNKPYEKVKMIEYLDKSLFKFLFRFCSEKRINLVVTADHSTPCKLKSHSADPVPLLWYNLGIPREKIKFGEKACKVGRLGRIFGRDLLKRVGFSKT